MRHEIKVEQNIPLPISIHAPIVGCDQDRNYYKFAHDLISIHAPIVGCDEKSLKAFKTIAKFQSTHPSWGATL